MGTKKQKFTFKTEKSTGRWRSFYPDNHIVKLNKIIVGRIDDCEPYKIRLRIYKDDIMEDGNSNCTWKWIQLKKESKSLQEVKDFLNENIDLILQMYKIYNESN